MANAEPGHATSSRNVNRDWIETNQEPREAAKTASLFLFNDMRIRRVQRGESKSGDYWGQWLHWS